MARITVMGAGIFGLCAAFELARRGARVVVIERAQAGAGASGGVVGALAPHVPEQWNTKKAFQLESLLMAEAFWASVAQAGGGNPGYARQGRVQPLADDAAIERAQTRAENARMLWQGKADWRLCSAGSVPGLGVHSPSGMVVYDTLTARLAPRAAVEALVAAIIALGGEIRCGVSAAPEAGRVLWACGAAGLEDLGRSLGVPMGGGVKGQAALLQADWRDAPQLFVDGLHIVPHFDGTVAVGSTSERAFDAADTTDAALEALILQARSVCPELAQAPVVRRWAGLRPRSPSRAPMLGAWPGRAGHFVLNGGFKIGFGMAPGMAGLAADLLLEGEAAIPQGFRLSDNLPPA